MEEDKTGKGEKLKSNWQKRKIRRKRTMTEFKSMAWGLRALRFASQLHQLLAGRPWRIYLVLSTLPVGGTAHRASLGPQTIKKLPAMQEPRVWSLGQEDSLEKGMATHSSILAWKISTEEPGRLQPMGSPRIGHDWATDTFRAWLSKKVMIMFAVNSSED